MKHQNEILLDLYSIEDQIKLLDYTKQEDIYKGNRLRKELEVKIKFMHEIELKGYPGYEQCIILSNKLIQKLEYELNCMQNHSNKNDSLANTSNYESIIVLHYLLEEINKGLSKKNKIELLYFLRKQTFKSKAENTSEYKQLKDIFSSGSKNDLLKKHGKKAANFLQNIGLNSISDTIMKDISGY